MSKMISVASGFQYSVNIAYDLNSDEKLKNFILGGGHGTDDGIFQYKAALAPNGIYDFYVGTDIFCEEKYQKLCDIRKMEDPYFNESEKLCPAYRF